ncbi:SusC/RagA family TonB-linked outer membrane protein [Chitinophaga tropicalis]|nr:SusC/RagA family TonB-linked outer membrane protein [Chitinophaga tropicalis]
MRPGCKTFILYTANLLLCTKHYGVLTGKHFFIVITISLFCNAASAQHRVSLSARQITIEEALRKIEAQTGYHAWTEDGVLEKAHKIDIDVNNLGLEQVLEIVFRNQPLAYKVIGQTIVVKLNKENPALLYIKGIVVSEGQPVESASVQLKGSARGVITGTKGEFSLARIPTDTILIVSYVGYQTREVIVGDEKVLQIELFKAAQQLDEPVVIGYGTTSKRTNPGSVGILDSRQIGIQPVTNPLLALQGRIPGLFIQQATGVTDGEVKVSIGGQNSIASGNEPFYVIDGVPFPSATLIQAGGRILVNGSPLVYLNPQDIESISILKDADATAIYGSRGANGVILITTKKGNFGNTKITGYSVIGIARVASKMKLLSTPEYLTMRREAFKNDQTEPDPTVDYDLLSWDTTRNIDWQKELIGRTAYIFQERLSISGRNKQTTYYVSGGYRRETTVFPGTFYNSKGSLHASFNTIGENRKLALNLSVNAALDTKTLPALEPTAKSLTLPPNAPSGYNTDGTFNWAPGYDNPNAKLHQLYKACGNNLIADVNLAYNPLKGLKVKANFGITSTVLKEITPVPVNTINPVLGITTSSSLFANKVVRSWIAEPQFEYIYYLGPGKLTLLTGFTFQDISTNNDNLVASGYIDPSQLETTNGAANIDILDKNSSQYRYFGAFTRLRYDLKNRYIMEVTGRRDGSSRFAPNRQFATFGALGFAWLMMEEPWLKSKLSKVFNFAKLRSSYGITGNDQIGDYQFVDTWQPTTYPYDNRIGLNPLRLYNSEYGWESNRKLNVGFDAALLKNRIQFVISYYLSHSSNQLIEYPLSGITGFPYVQGNLGVIVMNRAVEWEINTLNIKSASTKWTTSLNLTIPRNKLRAFPKLLGSNYAYQYIIGRSLNVFKAFHFLGVNGNTGIYIFEDVDKDGHISFPNDLAANKNVGQKFYGGMLNTVSYKQLSMDIFIQFIKQTGYNYLYGISSMPGMLANQPKYVLSRWQNLQSPGDVERFSQQVNGVTYTAYSNLIASDAVVSDASYIRVKNISLAYCFSGRILRRIRTTQAKLFLQGQNVFTISSYKGVDPENQSINNTLPPLRIYIFGVEITFN